MLPLLVSMVVGVCGEEGSEGAWGPATDSRLARCYGIDPDADGATWVADTCHHQIRVVNS